MEDTPIKLLEKEIDRIEGLAILMKSQGLVNRAKYRHAEAARFVVILNLMKSDEVQANVFNKVIS